MHDAHIYSVSPDPPPQEVCLRLEGYDLWMTFIKIVYYLPSNLDFAAFQQSLAKSLAIYWPASGRLSRDEHGWKVDSIGSSVTVSATSLLESSATLLDEKVVQDDLSAFLPPSLPSGPLVSFKLTQIPGGASYLGVRWHHALGDASTLQRFMGTLSATYQGIDKYSPHPSFEKHRFPFPTDDTVCEYAPSMPHLVHAAQGPEIWARYSKRNESIIPFRFIVLKTTLSAFRESLQAGSDIKLSVQDCLTAYLTAALNRCSPGAVRKITNAAQYRQNVLSSPDLAGNPIYIIPTESIDPRHSSDVLHIAQLIRRSITQSRTTEFIEGYMSTASKYMADAADEDKQFFFGSESDVLTVNSTACIPWQSATFGSRGPVQVYKTGVSRLYLRISSANATASYRSEEALDGCVGIPETMYSRFVKSLPLDGNVLHVA